MLISLIMLWKWHRFNKIYLKYNISRLIVQGKNKKISIEELWNKKTIVNNCLIITIIDFIKSIIYGDSHYHLFNLRMYIIW